MGWPGVDDRTPGPCADAQGTGDDGGGCAIHDYSLYSLFNTLLQ